MEDSTLESDLKLLPPHLHEWARNIEELGNRFQRNADAMKRVLDSLALKCAVKSILGEEQSE